MIDKSVDLSISAQCKLLNLNRTSFYYLTKEETEENTEIKRLLSIQYLVTPFFGYRKMTEWLQRRGFKVNTKRVKRLMKSINWKTIYKAPRTTIAVKEHKKYPYLLKNLQITHRNQVWATDITYIPMAKGFMYLTAIIDLHTRYVLNWSVRNSMSANWCAGVLKETIDEHGKPEIFNTDQGSQYTSDVHTNLLHSNGIEISMDGKGRAIDNILIERLWRTVKYEDVYLQAYTDGIALHNGLKNYFDFYNNERYHQSLDYKTPSEMYYISEAA
jgi:putative transposase